MTQYKNKCGKMIFPSKAEAKKFMKEANKIDKIGFTNAYWCEACSAWHLTTQPKKRSRFFTRKLNNA